jgi:CheY-like chemotaxis protein
MLERKSLNKNVLVIDDSEESRTLVSVILTEAGYLVTGAGDAARAVEELKSDRYAVILLDFKMPHDGVAMIDYMGENLPDTLAKTVVFIPSVNRPIWGVLPKPFDIRELMSTVKACADQNRS